MKEGDHREDPMMDRNLMEKRTSLCVTSVTRHIARNCRAPES